jgi:hypothetical protein
VAAAVEPAQVAVVVEPVQVAVAAVAAAVEPAQVAVVVEPVQVVERVQVVAERAVSLQLQEGALLLLWALIELVLLVPRYRGLRSTTL